MKYVIIIAIAVTFLFVPTTAYGAEGYFENDYTKELSSSPTVCIFQPDDYRVTEQKWNIWYPMMVAAIDTWESVLKQSGSGNWDIRTEIIPLNKLDLLNYAACDIKVQFTGTSYLNEPTWSGWYTYGTGNIVVMLTQYEYCGKEFIPEYNVYVNKKCFIDDVERPKKMAATLQHEMGHAFGLSHYVSDNYQLMQYWLDNPLGMPSIMTFRVDNEDIRKITEDDVNFVRSIYGSNGFGDKNNQIPIFNELPMLVKSSLTTTITLSENSQSEIWIQGNIPDKLFKRGEYLKLIIQKPDGTIEVRVISVDKTWGFYKYPLTFDYSFPIGTYEIAHKFNDEIFYREEVNVSKEPTHESKSDLMYSRIALDYDSYPAWLSHILYWYVMEDISPDEFVSALDYLNDKHIICMDICSK